MDYQPPLFRVGIGTPQANPTVEPEFRSLLPANVHMHTARLIGRHPDSRKKLLEYLSNLPDTLATYDTLSLDMFGFACTGSSYLAEPGQEQRMFESMTEKHGYPIVSCAQAIVDALESMGAESIALVCPYPTWLTEASVAFWQRHGIDVLAAHTLNPDAVDTRSIYELDPRIVLGEAMALLDDKPADVVLIAGTGLPTLDCVPQLSTAAGKPVLTSNTCLAWRLLRDLGGDNALVARSD
jgi:maleate isomerase